VSDRISSVPHVSHPSAAPRESRTSRRTSTMDPVGRGLAAGFARAIFTAETGFAAAARLRGMLDTSRSEDFRQPPGARYIAPRFVTPSISSAVSSTVVRHEPAPLAATISAALAAAT
jgi:hypothetical protein